MFGSNNKTSTNLVVNAHTVIKVGVKIAICTIIDCFSHNNHTTCDLIRLESGKLYKGL